MGRAPCCSKVGLHRGPWTTTEDSLLANYIQTHGEGQWRSLPTNAGLLRCGKSCRLRWMNYLRPDIKRGDISPDEDDLIIRMHALLGNRWSLIAGRLPGRTDNEIKNYWNTHLSKQLRKQGTDPNTHKKITDLDQTPPKPKRKPRTKKKKPNKTTTATTTTTKKVTIMKPTDEATKVVLHQPKATRVKSLIVSSPSLSLTRNSSFESTLTTVSPPPWPLYNLCGPMEEDRAGVGRAGFLIGGDQDDDMAVPHASSDLDKLYNEYFQLINHHMDRDLDQARELDSFAESLLV